MKRDAKNFARRRGSVLLVTIVIVLALASMTMVLCRSMGIEAMASANRSSAIEASAIERGGEQYVMAVITDQTASAVMTLDDSNFNAIHVGNGWFWVLRPDYGDPNMPVFGLVDECSKLDINYATYDELMALPNMTDDVATSILAWHNSSDPAAATGADSSYYSSLPQPYTLKGDVFETVEELLMVRGFTHDMLYGDSSNSTPLGQINSGQSQTMGAGQDILTETLPHGLYNFLTVSSLSPPTNGGTTNNRGKVNVNTAPREVLYSILYDQGMQESDIDNALAQRASSAAFGTTDNSWFTQAVGSSNAIGRLICTSSLRFSADILAITGDGKAFKRCRVIIDASGTTPQIIYRRDITNEGWPMDKSLLDQIRAGQGTQIIGSGGSYTAATLGGIQN